MKKMIFTLVLLITAGTCFAQRGPVAPFYGYHSDNDLIAMINRGSDTATSFVACIVGTMNICLKDTTFRFQAEWMEWLLREKSTSEEVDLKAGEYYNAGFNPTTGKVEFFLAKVDFHGFARIATIGTFRIFLFKEDCWNPLRYSLPRIKKISPPPQQKAITSGGGKGGHAGGYSPPTNWGKPGGGYGGHAGGYSPPTNWGNLGGGTGGHAGTITYAMPPK